MISELKINKFLTYVIFSFGLYPITPDRFKGVFVGILLLLSIFYFFISKPHKLDFKTFIINSSLYLILLLSLFYTENLTNAIKMLTETRLAAIIFPIIFLLLSQNKEIYKEETVLKIKKIFTFSTFIFCVLFFISLPFKTQEADPFFQFPSVFYFRNGLMEIPLIGVEPIYGSVYIGISIIFVVTDIIKTRKRNLFQMISLGVFLTILFLLSSKMTILALILLILVSTFLSQAITIKKKIIYTLVIASLSVSFLKIPTIEQRTKELFKKETYLEYKRHNSTSIRLSILRCGLNISGNNLFFGVGMGDVENELIDCYETISYDLVQRKYNSHNQYLSILIGTGLFGLLVFLVFLVYNLMLSYKFNKKATFLIIVFYTINMLSENLLERQNGIILFFFFICYFTQSIVVQNKNKYVNF